MLPNFRFVRAKGTIEAFEAVTNQLGEIAR